MLQVKPVWSALQVQFAFQKPILEWEHLQGRFFKMIYDALSGTVPLNSKEFSVVGANQLSEVKARWSVYGGASSVSLSADNLLFDFPSLVGSDSSVVQNILLRLHNAFNETFQELPYQTIVVQLNQHMEFLDDKIGPTEFLSKFALPSAKGLKSVVVHPGTRFELVSENWKCSVGVERSIPNARAVFVGALMTMNNVGPSMPYDAKAALARKIHKTCLDLLELEAADGVG